MVDEHDNSRAGRELHRVFRAVAPENQAAAGIFIIDVRVNRQDRERRFRHEPDVDPAVVVAVDDHHVRVGGSTLTGDHARIREMLQSDPALRLDDRDDVSIHILDHLRVVGHGELVHSFLDQVDPANPVASAIRDDLGARRMVGCGAVTRNKAAAYLSEDGERRGIGGRQAEYVQKLEDLNFDRQRVAVLQEKRVDPRVSSENWVPPGCI